ncbi:Dabb family protein [Flavobacteriaceae bacterium]|nr:Dabb family protein [Flavobacteriaceae bacterium]
MPRVGITDRLSFVIIVIFYLTTLIIGYFFIDGMSSSKEKNNNRKMLVHLVLIQFKDETTPEDFQKITDGAYGLQAIPGVEALNFGENVSPEGLKQGFTHSLTMKFASSLDRDSIYLPHPIHQKFVELFVPNTKSVLVYDYWE